MKTAAMVASKAGFELSRSDIDLGAMGPEQVEIAVESCGVCHSDLSMLGNEWGLSAYPLVAGHEVIGRISAMGAQVKGLKVGQRVGLGWFSASCMGCRQCMTGNHNLCPTVEQTIVGRAGGFASRVRSHWAWATPLPEGVDADKAGPLFCGGITVFNPIVQLGIKPTDKVGVVGIGGLGHLALQFLNKWGCEVTAFTSSSSKSDEAKRLGAHYTVSSRDDAALAKLKGQFDFILVTANVTLNWPAFIGALAPRGKLHFVGAVLEPVPVGVFDLLMGQKSVSGSPLGSPATTAQMLDFCARHKIAPVTETFSMSEATKAIKHVHEGKARYRVVLKNDLG